MILRNGPLERVSFSDTEIDEDLLAPVEPFTPPGLNTESGFYRVAQGVMWESRQRRKAQRSRLFRYLLVLILASGFALYRTFFSS